MGLAGALDGLETRLKTLTGVGVYRRPVENPRDLPALIIKHDHVVEFYGALGSPKHPRHLVKVVLVLKTADLAEAVATGEPFLEATGAQSVFNAIDGDKTLGGNADMANVTGTEPWTLSDVGGVGYLSTAFNVEVDL